MFNDWVKEFQGAVTLCDKEGIIIYMNDRATEIFKSDGGDRLIGQNVFDCHPAGARVILQDLMDNRKTNVYTIEKNGIKKIIYQSPWYDNGIYSGFVELSLEIPFQLPHFNRNKNTEQLT